MVWDVRVPREVEQSAAESPTADPVPVRYGVFLTPDPATSAAVASVTGFIRAQYGLVSAGAFPPHATLAGSLPISDGAQLEHRLDTVLRRRPAIPIENRGVRILGDIVIYDIDSIDGRPNEALRELAIEIDSAVRPLIEVTSGLAADTHDGSRFHAHLSLASHELYGRPDLLPEVAAYAEALPVHVPPRFTADTVTLYRFEHPSWEGAWWTSMTWTHRRTWRLTPAS